MYVNKLGIRPQEISTQVLPRDLHAEYFASMALIATSIEKFATESVDCKKSETKEKLKSFLLKGKKGLPQCRTNAILLVQKIWRD